MILTKKKPIKVIDKLGIDRFDQEGRFLLLEYNDFYIINISCKHMISGLVLEIIFFKLLFFLKKM